MKCDVLVVDDSDEVRDLLQTALELEGFFVRVARDGGDALAILRQGVRPAVVLLDLMMPIVSGIEFLRIQRSDPAIATIPVIAVTAAGDALTQAADVQMLVKKPMDLDQLIVVVRAVCSRAV